MSQLVQLDHDIRGVVGLEWGSVVDTAWKAKRKEIKADKQAALAFFQVQSGDGDTLINYGLTDRQSVIDSRLSKKDQPVSLAGLLALSNPSSGICVLERPEGQDNAIWFCLSQNGQIVTGTDFLGSFEEVEQLLENYRDLIEDGRFTVVGNASDIFDPTAEAKSASDFIDEGHAGGAAINVGKEGMGVVGLTLVIGAFVSVCIASYYIFLHDSDNGQADLSAAEAAAMQRASAEEALRQKKNEIREAGELHGTLLIMNQFLIHYAPMQVQGWSLSKARCANKICTLEYQNEDWSPVELLATLTEDVCELAVTTNGEAAVCTAEHEVSKLAEAVPEKGDWLMERTAINEIRRRLMEIASRSGESGFNLSGPTNINIPGSQFLKGESTIAEGKITLNTGIARLDETVAFLGSDLPVAFDEATYDFEKGSIEIKAQFYVHGE